MELERVGSSGSAGALVVDTYQDRWYSATGERRRPPGGAHTWLDPISSHADAAVGAWAVTVRACVRAE
jgi:hypothetical protein